MSVDRKNIGYKTRIVSELIYEDELVQNITMEICYKATNTNPSSIYISRNICLEGYNRYELYGYINSDYSVCFHKKSILLGFIGFMWKKVKNLLRVRIYDNSIMSHNEVIKGLCIEIGGV